MGNADDIVQKLQELHLTQPALRPDPAYFFPNIIPIEIYLAHRGTPPLVPQSCLGGMQELEKLREQIFCSVRDSLIALLSGSLGGRLRDARFTMIPWQDCVTPCVDVVVESSTVLDWCELEGQIRALLAKIVARSTLVFEVRFEIAND
jgi:hypothetical protein